MPSYFLNSSATVKCYHREPGTSRVQRLCERRTHPPRHLSALAAAANVPDELILVVADTRLAAIVPLEGLRVVNLTYPPPGSPA
ncbi:MAG TPA: hypothetical protein VGP82_19125 [Ktedonobacterales bacterium]|nr:hypothetical protein [Ktedonobacterales bacterium]